MWRGINVRWTTVFLMGIFGVIRGMEHERRHFASPPSCARGPASREKLFFTGLACFNALPLSTVKLIRDGVSLEALLQRPENSSCLVNARDERGRTPLMCAAKLNAVDIAEKLIAAGADINASDDDENSVLHYAVGTHDPRVLALLLRFGANQNCQNKLHLTPLHKALNGRYYSAAKMLARAKNVPVTLVDSEGFSVLHRAVEKGDIEVVQLLVEAGACLDSQDPSAHLTPLHIATYKNYRAIAVLLLKAGADWGLPDFEDKTAGHAHFVNKQMRRIINGV